MRILGGGVAVLLLSACGPGTGGVVVPPGYDDLDPCAVREIAAADLAGIGAPGCDLAGSTVVFPDGYRFALQEVGAAAVESPDVAAGIEYHSANWGVPGAAVAKVETGEVVEAWATSMEAMDLQRQQFGVEGLRYDG